MNNSLQEQLLQKVCPPKQAEIWYADDDKILMDDPNKKDKNNRPVLVVAHSELLKVPCNIVNIIPLSTSGNPDRIRFPIGTAFENVCNDFHPDENSLALLALYQPLRVKCFQRKCATLNSNTYSAILLTLCQYVIGFDALDFTP